MAEELNLTALELEDNDFELLPDGDYHFTVASHEIGYYSGNSDKIPPNTQQLICHLEIPYMKDGTVKTAKVRNTFNVYRKALFAIRTFAECIGLAPEKGKVSFDATKIDGMTGICNITTNEASNGKEYNNVQIFYQPSKAPTAAANDDAWLKKDDFMGVPDANIPFDI